ncbi:MULTISPECIES: hypothetical protein [unclassified Agarivorans]|uniref:hypothetical protein n=1 Tax=unclassified Agarivorans TaxID=2636026 RepID=UPI003D7E534A
MRIRRWQQRVSWLLILSVFAFAFVWGEHQVEKLNPHHSEHHCPLCFHLGQLSTAICSSALFIAFAVVGITYQTVNYRYTWLHTLRAIARAPPVLWY